MDFKTYLLSAFFTSFTLVSLIMLWQSFRDAKRLVYFGALVGFMTSLGGLMVLEQYGVAPALIVFSLGIILNFGGIRLRRLRLSGR